MVILSDLVRKNLDAARAALMSSTLPNSTRFVRVMVPFSLCAGLEGTVYGLEIMPTVGLEENCMIFQTRADIERSKSFVSEAYVHPD